MQIIDPAALGRSYQIIKKLGEGRFSTVYLVENKQGKKFALKVLKTQAAGILERLQREFILLTQFNHPNLVKIFPQGSGPTPNGFSIMMEYLEGQTLKEIISRRSPVRQSAWKNKNFYSLIVQICRALEYIHSKGYIHFDIKPGNVFVTKTNQVKLLDFGLALEQSARGGQDTQDRRQATGDRRLSIRGTPGYIAPEILSGKAYDHRVDLYSLGSVIYEMLFNELPRLDAFIPPHELDPEIPQPLEKLLVSLLAGEPEHRPRHANEVIAAINQMSGESYELETPKSYLLRSKFVGRESELTELKANLAKFKQGEAVLPLYITGVAGIGKSRLMEEFSYLCRLEGVECLMAKADPSPYTPFPLFLDNLRDKLGSSKLTQQYQDLIKDFRPEVSRGRREAGERLTLFYRIGNFLLEVTRDRPLIFIIDDLQVAPVSTLELLQHFIRRKGRFCFIGCVRTPDVKSGREGEENVKLTQLINEGEKLELLPLSSNSQAELIASLLGEEIPSPVGTRVKELGGGNPFYTEELIKSFLDAGILVMELAGLTLRGDLSKIELPRFPSELIKTHLNKLDPVSLTLLQVVSVSRLPINWEVIRVVGNFAESELLQLYELKQRGILKEVDSNWQFTHPLYQEVVYKELMSEDEQVKLHAEFGEVLEGISGKKNVEELAYHYDLSASGGSSHLTDKAIYYLKEAAERATRLYLPEEALNYYQRIFELTSSPNYELYFKRAEVKEWLGKLKEAEADYARAQELARELDDKSKEFISLLALGRCVLQEDQYDKGISYLKEMEKVKRNLSLAEQGDFYSFQGELGTKNDQYALALRSFQTALKIYKKKKNSYKVALMGEAIAQLYQIQGSYLKAKRYLLGAEVAFRELNCKRELIRVLQGLGVIAWQQGEWKSSENYVVQVLKQAEKLQDPVLIANCLQTLGIIYEELELHSKAIAAWDKASKLQEEMGRKRALISLLANSGIVHRNITAYEKAYTSLQKALSLAQELEDKLQLVQVLRELGKLKIWLFVPQEAQVLLNRALKIVKNLRLPSEEGIITWYLGHLALEKGNLSEAEKQFKKSSAIFDRIKDKVHLGYIFYYLGKLYFLWGKNERVKFYAQQLEDLARETKGKANYAWAFEVWGYYCSLKVEKVTEVETVSKKAIYFLNKALQVRKKYGYWEYVWELYYHLAELYLKRGKRRASYAKASASADRSRLRPTKVGGKKAQGYYAKAKEVINDIVTRVPEEYRNSYLSQPLRKKVMEKSKELQKSEEMPVRLWRKKIQETGITRKKLLTLYEIAQVLNSIHELNALLNKVMDLVIELLKMERGMVFFFNEETKNLQVKVARNMEKETLSDAQEISKTVLKEVKSTGRPLWVANALGDPRFKDIESVIRYHLVSFICVPLKLKEKFMGLVYVDTRRKTLKLTQTEVDFVTTFSNLAAVAIENAKFYEELRGEITELQGELKGKYRFENLVGKSKVMEKIFELMGKAAQSDAVVLIEGESGTGKELVARAIHFNSNREEGLPTDLSSEALAKEGALAKAGKFIPIDCGALPEDIAESELFGHKKGAFTDAREDKIGLFEAAHLGTVFLDEVGNLTPALQAKLLRVLETGEIRRVGESKNRMVDCRVIAATNKDLKREMDAGRFREDLYYRLNVIKISLPPLRERKEDVPYLVSHFLGKLKKGSKGEKRVSGSAMKVLMECSWPGNVRELEHALERAHAVTNSKVIKVEDLPSEVKVAPVFPETLFPLPQVVENLERRAIAIALQKCNGSKIKAAQILGIGRATLHRKLKLYGLHQKWPQS